MSDLVVIRNAHSVDLPSLPEVERRAAALFAGHAVEPGVRGDVTSLAMRQTISDRPVGHNRNA